MGRRCRLGTTGVPFDPPRGARMPLIVAPPTGRPRIRRGFALCSTVQAALFERVRAPPAVSGSMPPNVPCSSGRYRGARRRRLTPFVPRCRREIDKNVSRLVEGADGGDEFERSASAPPHLADDRQAGFQLVRHLRAAEFTLAQQRPVALHMSPRTAAATLLSVFPLQSDVPEYPAVVVRAQDSHHAALLRRRARRRVQGTHAGSHRTSTRTSGTTRSTRSSTGRAWPTA